MRSKPLVVAIWSELFGSHNTFVCAVIVTESNLLPSRDVQESFMLVSTAVKMETMGSLFSNGIDDCPFDGSTKPPHCPSGKQTNRFFNFSYTIFCSSIGASLFVTALPRLTLIQHPCVLSTFSSVTNL